MKYLVLRVLGAITVACREKGREKNASSPVGALDQRRTDAPRTHDTPNKLRVFEVLGTASIWSMASTDGRNTASTGSTISIKQHV